MESRQYFECLACGRESEIGERERPRCAQCGSGNGIISPTRMQDAGAALHDAGDWYDRFPYLIDQASYSRVLMQGDFVPDTDAVLGLLLGT